MASSYMRYSHSVSGFFQVCGRLEVIWTPISSVVNFFFRSKNSNMAEKARG